MLILIIPETTGNVIRLTGNNRIRVLKNEGRWPMSLTMNFPNPSRSFDPTRNRVRFWGYDSAIEISFFVDVAALQKLSPKMNLAEVGVLKAFDAALERIHDVALKAYKHGRKGIYDYSLTVEDF